MSGGPPPGGFRCIAVIGGGAWGTALANAAAFGGREVVLWMRDPAQAEAAARDRTNARYLPGVELHRNVRPTASAEDLRDQEACLLVVPAQTVRDTLWALGPALPPGVPVVLCAKGIERSTGAFLSEVATSLHPGGPVGILSGPSFAADVARGLPTAVTLALEDTALGRDLAEALSGPSLRVYRTTDVRGVEIGGAAKNVLAIGAGIVEGRGLGDSAKAALIARGFAELLRFAVAQGGRRETLMGLSGLGDVILSCGSAQSRNFAYGLRLGRGLAAGEAAGGQLAEGAFTAQALVVRAAAAGIEMPVAEAVSALVSGRVTVDRALADLMSRPLREEG